jgi:hypothetical protein
MLSLAYRVKELLAEDSFSENDTDLQIVMALMWQFYQIENGKGFPYNPALVAEFYARKSKQIEAGAVSTLNSNYALHELTLAEIIRRARRAIQLLGKYNLPMLTQEEQINFEENLIWPNAQELSRDEAAELLLVAFMEMENSSDRRVEIHDIKRIIINCLEQMKFRGKGMYKFICYSSDEEYETTLEDDAEIYSCLANSEEEATEIAYRQNYWLVKLVGFQSLGDSSSR